MRHKRKPSMTQINKLWKEIGICQNPNPQSSRIICGCSRVSGVRHARHWLKKELDNRLHNNLIDKESLSVERLKSIKYGLNNLQILSIMEAYGVV